MTGSGASGVPRVLVVTMASGEPQLARVRRSVNGQAHVQATQEVIDGLGMAAAGVAAHHLIDESALDYDWFLLLNADMVLVGPDSLATLIQCAERRRATQRLTTPVLDSFTRSQINGLHLIRGRSPLAIADAEDGIFHDSWVAALTGITIDGARNPQALHAPDADVPQSLRFGLQRGMKALAGGPRSGRWDTIDLVVANWRRGRTPALDAALLGILAGLGRGPVEPHADIVNESDPGAIRLLAMAEDGSAGAIVAASELSRPWGTWRLHRSLFGSPAATARSIAAMRKRQVAHAAGRLRETI